MGMYESFARLTRLMLSNQGQFYIDNQKLDADFLAKYGTVVEEAEAEDDDDEQEPLTDDSEGGSGTPASGDSGEAGQAHATD